MRKLLVATAVFFAFLVPVFGQPDRTQPGTYTAPGGAFTIGVKAKPEIGSDSDEGAKATLYVFYVVAGIVSVNEVDNDTPLSDAGIDAIVSSTIQERREIPGNTISDVIPTTRNGFRGRSLVLTTKDNVFLELLVGRGTRYFEVTCQFKRDADEAKNRLSMQQILDSFTPSSADAASTGYVSPDGRFTVAAEGAPTITQLQAPEKGEKYRWTTSTSGLFITRNIVEVGTVTDERAAAVSEQFRKDVPTLYQGATFGPSTPLRIGDYKGIKFQIDAAKGRVVVAILIGPDDVYRISSATTDMSAAATAGLYRVVDSFLPKSSSAAAQPAAYSGPVYTSTDGRFQLGIPGEPQITKLPNGDTRYTWKLDGGDFIIRVSPTKHPLSEKERRDMLAQFNAALGHDDPNRPAAILDLENYSVLTVTTRFPDGDQKEFVVPTPNAVFDIKILGQANDTAFWKRTDTYSATFRVRSDGEKDYRSVFATKPKSN
jgi:hypothetical protein